MTPRHATRIRNNGLSKSSNSCLVERHKPEPDIFLEPARRLGVAAKHCRVYEDTDPGIEAARRAWMEPVDVRSFHTLGRVTWPIHQETRQHV